MTKKDVEATVLCAYVAITAAKASIDQFKEGCKSESKRGKAVRYLTGAGTAFAAITFGIVAYIGVYDAI